MQELLKCNNKIIVNTDIDGILSAFVLCKYCNCEIVGFSNSAECVWWRSDKINSIYDAVYIDMYVQRKDVYTIDQHIIAFNKDNLSEIASLGTKMNPNIDNPRTFIPNCSYYLKYPFGTVHYILSKLGKAGIDIHFEHSMQVSSEYGDVLRIADFILRADDAMTTSLYSNYVDNAKEWWWWLKRESNMSANIVSLTEYLNSCVREKINVLGRKSAIAAYFKLQFGCDSPDGGFSSVTDANGYILNRVEKYIKFFFSLLGGVDALAFLNDVFSSKYCISRGKAIRICMTAPLAKELSEKGTVNGEEVFSYGYVRSSNRPANFSYTVM